jgi:hypothetical protein
MSLLRIEPPASSILSESRPCFRHFPRVPYADLETYHNMSHMRPLVKVHSIYTYLICLPKSRQPSKRVSSALYMVLSNPTRNSKRHCSLCHPKALMLCHSFTHPPPRLRHQLQNCLAAFLLQFDHLHS